MPADMRRKGMNTVLELMITGGATIAPKRMTWTTQN